jgi:hypothetical protein
LRINVEATRGPKFIAARRRMFLRKNCEEILGSLSDVLAYPGAIETIGTRHFTERYLVDTTTLGISLAMYLEANGRAL